MIDVIRSICGNIFGTFGWWGGFFTGDAGFGRIAGVFCSQALLEALISSGSLRSGRASWKKGETEQTEGDFNFHGAKNVIQLRVYNYYNSAPNGKHFFTVIKTGSKSARAS